MDEAIYERKNIYYRWNIEALKLLYDTDLRLLLQSSYIAALLIIAGVLSIWMGILWPSIPDHLKASWHALLYQSILTTRILFLCFGYYYGYMIPILDRLAKIRKAIAERV